MKRKILSIICVLCLILCLGIKSFADFGDFGGDTDYGGGSDWGSSDWGSSDYDYDDDDDYDYDDDDDNSSSYNSYYSYVGFPDGSDGSGGGSIILNSLGKSIAAAGMLSAIPDDDNSTDFIGTIMLIGIAASIIIGVKRKNSPSGSNKSYRSYTPQRSANLPAGAQPTDASTLKNISSFTDVDPNFSETEFCSDISNMYVKFQNAWQDKNIEELRPYLTDEFYARIDRQLDNYRRNHQTNMVERIAVLGVTISGWKEQKGENIIVARVRTRIVDYVVDDNTNKIIRGSNTAEKFMEYEWTLSRKAGVKTGVDSGIRTINCPNCGAPLNISKTSKCEYCGSIVTVDSTDWVVTDMKGLSQRTR